MYHCRDESRGISSIKQNNKMTFDLYESGERVEIKKKEGKGAA